MHFVSLFAGIGGIDLGLERAGMRCVAQVEKDEYCQRVLAKHWPDVPRFEDVRDFGRDSINGTVDLIAGGFPCQPFSEAGERRGADDDRHLWPEMLRIVQEFKPRWVLGENVPGIIPLFLDQALADLEAEGYEAWTLILPALAFDAPHIRRRVFIVAYSEGNRSQKRTRQNGQSEQGGIQQSRLDAFRKGGALAYATIKRKRLVRGKQLASSGNQAREIHLWQPEPAVCRVADGIPNRVDRLRALGNAVVPQVAQFLGELIMEAEAAYYDK